MTEDRGQLTEDKGQRTIDRGQRTEDKGQLTVFLPGVRRALILLDIIENGKWRIENEGHFSSLHSEKF